ncbi:cyclic AMP receptor-like protein A [Aplysia californica]|uniref:Cyclic AMP receptor-like protein A n=1 Tax=Aplysia californica TaxID=6500 RepID=A0ABM1VPK5_APLCA|nr:cyclic AMP receptor-like protein A [Aplysia californica]
MPNSSCTSFPDNPDHCDVIIAVRQASGAFSLIGCVFMIFIIWLFRRYVVFAQRLILYLSIGALMDSIAYLMSSSIEDGPFCDFQGWWLTFFDWQVLLWVSCITFNLFMNVVRLAATAQFEWLYLGICWVVPLIISCLPFAGDVYGPAGAWCWIIEDISWRIGMWYGPLFVIIAFLIVAYVYIIYTLRRKASSWEGTYDPDTERQHQLMKEDIKPLRVYPFIYLAVSLFPLINRIQNAFSPESHVFVLVLLASISSPLHGALNAIAFGLDRETLTKLRPNEIRMALRSKMAPRATIQEYPQPDRDTDHLQY